MSRSNLALFLFFFKAYFPKKKRRPYWIHRNGRCHSVVRSEIDRRTRLCFDDVPGFGGKNGGGDVVDDVVGEDAAGEGGQAAAAGRRRRPHQLDAQRRLAGAGSADEQDAAGGRRRRRRRRRRPGVDDLAEFRPHPVAAVEGPAAAVGAAGRRSRRHGRLVLAAKKKKNSNEKGKSKLENGVGIPIVCFFRPP